MLCAEIKALSRRVPTRKLRLQHFWLNQFLSCRSKLINENLVHTITRLFRMKNFQCLVFSIASGLFCVLSEAIFFPMAVRFMNAFQQATKSIGTACIFDQVS